MQLENIEGKLTKQIDRNFILKIKELINKSFTNPNLFKLSCIRKEVRLNTKNLGEVDYFILSYLPWEDYHFDFYTLNSGSSSFHYSQEKDIDGNGKIVKTTLQAHNTIPSEVLKSIFSWIAKIKQEESDKISFELLMEGEDELTEDEKIKSSHKPFSSQEYDLLDKKLDTILDYIFRTQGLNLEAIQELKLMVEELKDKAKVEYKDNWQESVIGKVVKKGYEEFENKAYGAALGILLSEIAKIFSGTGFSELGAGINDLLLNS